MQYTAAAESFADPQFQQLMMEWGKLNALEKKAIRLGVQYKVMNRNARIALAVVGTIMIIAAAALSMYASKPVVLTVGILIGIILLLISYVLK